MLGPGEFHMAACRYDAFFDGDAVYMALEFMDMGTLSTMIQVPPVYAHSVGRSDGRWATQAQVAGASH